MNVRGDNFVDTYRWPSSGFKTLDEARCWVEKFTRWYNAEHHHSGIGYVTPEQRHAGEDRELLNQRDRLYREARARHPERGSRGTRTGHWTAEVRLTPERETQAARMLGQLLRDALGESHPEV